VGIRKNEEDNELAGEGSWEDVEDEDMKDMLVWG